jgi:8-hydroxy-5-deazaflavin:NADPH oxidoreductase
MEKNVGIIGSGVVGQVLANGFLKNGYKVMIGTRDKSKLAEWIKSAGAGASVGSFEECAAFGQTIVLAVKGKHAAEALKLAGEKNLVNKLVIDTTNPIEDAAPVNGVIKFYTNLNSSQMESLQNEFAKAHFVKAFSCVGNSFMVNPEFPEGKPTMFICGNNEASKDKVKEILQKFGWDCADMGKAEAARAIEPLCMLWCIPGLLENKWQHAFKLLRK